MVTPPRVIENDQAKILWDFQLQMDKLVMSNQLDIVVVDTQRKTAIETDVAIPSDSNNRMRDLEKLEKYLGLKEE